MSQPLPIACSFSGADFASRVAELRALGGDGLLSVSEEPGRAVLRFRPAADIRKRVEATAAAESECCAFLDFRVDHDAETTTLTITAPNGGAEVVSELAALFSGAR
jgi:MerR family transcriptional regulator, copper efflux regulator